MGNALLERLDIVELLRSELILREELEFDRTNSAELDSEFETVQDAIKK